MFFFVVGSFWQSKIVWAMTLSWGASLAFDRLTYGIFGDLEVTEAAKLLAQLQQ